jgi:superfamily II DNA or RNA helicase
MPLTHELLILTAPPASGKTFWINDYAKSVGPENILVISPLRALRDECHDRWREQIKVMTPEEWLLKKISKQIVIFDEFHLLIHWGSSFRPLMWEVFYELSCSAGLMIGLTATLSERFQESVKLFSHFNNILWVDCGNRGLKYPPRSYLIAPNKNWLLEEIFQQPPGVSTSIVFCRYRQEVFTLCEELRLRGFSVIGCVGGEAGKMPNLLRKNPQPDMIVSTTVLSHGVNLPLVTKVYFLYEVLDPDFWIQMVARGGRQGQGYAVFSLQRPFRGEWSWWQNLLRVWIGKLRHKMTLRGLFFVSE